MKLGEIAYLVKDKINSSSITLEEYVTTDSLLQDKKGRTIASNLPPNDCSLTRFEKDDILVANIRPYLKKVWKADVSGGASNDVLVFRAVQDIHADFLYAVLLQDSFYNHVMLAPIGAKMPRGEKNHILRYEIKVQSKESQEFIGSITTFIDRKISLNRKANEVLESMAKQLYDYWFVQFDFPNAEGKPYKSSGGKMVYNETLKREIPEGWEVKTLREFVMSKANRISIDETKGSKYAPIEVLPRKRMSFSDTAPLEKAASGLCTFSKYDILLSNRRVYFHKVCIAPFDGITRDTVFVIQPLDPDCLGFCYETLFTDRFIAHATQNSYGTEQPVLPWDAVINYAIAAPPQTLISRYCKEANFIIQKVIATELETLRLTSLRDCLLPLLMNGQVKVL